MSDQQPAGIEPAPERYKSGKGITHPAMPQCFSCGHSPRWLGKWGRYACTAYPDGIPQAIIDNRYDHRQPQAGDRGLRWTPKKSKSGEVPHPLESEIFTQGGL